MAERRRPHGPIGPVNISAAHAQKAARSARRRWPSRRSSGSSCSASRRARGATTRPPTCCATRSRSTASTSTRRRTSGTRPTAARAGAADRAAAAASTLSDDEIRKILAARQAARLRHDFKTADRLRDQLNEQCVSVDDKKNRWDAADGRSGNIEPFTCVHPPPAEAPPAAAARPAANGAKADDAGPLGSAVAAAAAAAKAAGADAKGDSKRVLPEKARRELAKKLREITGASARLCEKALQSHSDDMERAADWLLNERDAGRDADTNGA